MFGSGTGSTSYWGEQTTFLGWYATEEALSKEIRDIQSAILGGEAAYELRYAARTKRRWMSVKIVGALSADYDDKKVKEERMSRYEDTR